MSYEKNMQMSRGWCGFCQDLVHTASGTCFCPEPCMVDWCPKIEDGSNPFEVKFL